MGAASPIDQNGWGPILAARRSTSPSTRKRSASGTSQSRVACSTTASSTGCTSVGELLMTRRISPAAACCSRLSVRSRRRTRRKGRLLGPMTSIPEDLARRNSSRMAGLARRFDHQVHGEVTEDLQVARRRRDSPRLGLLEHERVGQGIDGDDDPCRRPSEQEPEERHAVRAARDQADPDRGRALARLATHRQTLIPPPTLAPPACVTKKVLPVKAPSFYPKRRIFSRFNVVRKGRGRSAELRLAGASASPRHRRR